MVKVQALFAEFSCHEIMSLKSHAEIKNNDLKSDGKVEKLRKSFNLTSFTHVITVIFNFKLCVYIIFYFILSMYLTILPFCIFAKPSALVFILFLIFILFHFISVQCVF